MAKAAAEVMVRNGKPHLVHFGDVILKPGVNKVKASVAEAMAKSPHISKLNSITISDAPPSTKKLTPDEAEELIKDTNDGDLLNEYRAEDARPEVAKAVADKKAEISPTEVQKG